MRFVMFYHSLVSDWNHGNAHFLRGVAAELQSRGHAVDVYEPCDGWSLSQLRRETDRDPVEAFERAYPSLRSTFYDLETLDLDRVLAGADVVLVHEWNPPELVRRLGAHRAAGGGYRLLFHDTHHRAVTAPQEMARYDLSRFDGVLAFGRVIRDLYLAERRVPRAWTWHEGADTRLFRPRDAEKEGDLVWIGNWGDGERSGELREYLFEPVRKLGLRARVYGVQYPEHGRKALREAGIEYGGWIRNDQVPEAFARFRATVHIPRRPYRESIPGIPTIRVFEALACGIPLVSLSWEDLDGLFTAGKDYLVAQTGEEMAQHLNAVLSDGSLARQLAEHGRNTILARHTCAHRVDELLAICREISPAGAARSP